MSQDEDNYYQEISEKLNIDIDWARSISPEEVLQLLQRCPFLQMTCPDESVESQSLMIHHSNAGWPIHDYGDSLTSSPGPLLYGNGYAQVLEDNHFEAGKGTIIKQAWDTAVNMMEFAKEKNWQNVKLDDGHPLMLRAAWIAAKKLGINVVNFEPDENDLRVESLVNLSATEFEALKKQIKPGR